MSWENEFRNSKSETRTHVCWEAERILISFYKILSPSEGMRKKKEGFFILKY